MRAEFAQNYLLPSGFANSPTVSAPLRKERPVACSKVCTSKQLHVCMSYGFPTGVQSCFTNLRILLAKSMLPICSWDWQISEPAFYEAIAPSDGCTDGFASQVREFANSIPSFLLQSPAGAIAGFRYV